MSVSTGLGQYVTPKWVFDAGAASAGGSRQFVPHGAADHSEDLGRSGLPSETQGLRSRPGATIRRQSRHRLHRHPLLRQLGRRAHRHARCPGIVLTPPENLKQNYFLPYIQAFPHTQLIVPWGSDMYDSVYDWAVARGAGMRRDGILSKWSKDGSECLRAHGHHPSVFEYCDGYDEMKKNGWWKPDMLRDTYFPGGKPPTCSGTRRSSRRTAISA